MKLHKTSLVLAAKYLVIIMLISGFFSINMYTASVQEIGRGYGRIGTGLNRSMNPEQFMEFREDQLELSRQALMNRLILINVLILVVGGVVSYYLARKTLEPIEAAHEAQNRFTSDASHELRTPITAIRSETEAFLMTPRPKISEAKAIMHSNIEELDKLTALTDGLLRLARSSKENLNPSKIALGELIHVSTDYAQREAGVKKITVHTDVKDSMQPVVVDVDLMSDAIKILFENAVKYSKDSTNIHLTADVHNSNLNITIVDEGFGIKQSQLPYIFDRFYQGDVSRSKSASSGFGIGLSIVKSIVDLHKGKIDVKSKVNQGTTFSVTIPQ